MKYPGPLTFPTVNYEAAIQWDVKTWRRALSYWEQAICEERIVVAKGLELGAHDGGLTYFFCKRYGSQMECSDRGHPTDHARNLHAAEGVSHLVSYLDVDATRIPFATESFDFVVFKSILGAIGAHAQYTGIKVAIGEIHRVLRPGGVLFFAENLRGSLLHRLGRALFVPWGRSWHYLTVAQLHNVLDCFAARTIHTTGCLAAFAPRGERLKAGLAAVDRWCPLIPRRWHYVAYGIARK